MTGIMESRHTAVVEQSNPKVLYMLVFRYVFESLALWVLTRRETETNVPEQGFRTRR